MRSDRVALGLSAFALTVGIVAVLRSGAGDGARPCERDQHNAKGTGDTRLQSG